MQFIEWLWMLIASLVLAAVCGGLWVDWKLNWRGKRKSERGFEVVQRESSDRRVNE